MHRRLRLITVCLLLCWGLWPPGARVLAVDIGADDTADQFVGSSSSAGQGPTAGRASSSTHECGDCVWMLADPCSSQYNALGCGTVTEGCAHGSEQRRQWFSSDGGFTWADRGLRCVSTRAATAVGPDSPALHDAFAQAVPAARIQVQPDAGVLPQVPTLFGSGQPVAAGPFTFDLAGSRVELRPTASWVWEFGDGGVLATSSPGSVFPDRTVSHTYRLSGEYEVRLVTTWTATYLLDGAGPFIVDGTITQEATRKVRVGQGRAVLLPNG
ncbi:MAG: PKD domain-containing protein [Candidatus Nanopelagicales bacterium]|nr:PKD domain-containing protein [Candidatus Nanopelagicales bacterium]